MEYLFVYGLFRDSARNLLGEFTKCGRAHVNGKIYKVNEFYPGLIEYKKSKVFGDVYLINPEVLPSLDEFEGDEYTRKKIKTSTDLECWVYVYKYEVSNFKEIEGGDWMLR
jgi:gamma-glutamylcyclotransferase (GGCT)/AIG2-like uncharacterized protein YtfP